MKQNKPYQGFEIGPIRPPSEAESLMLRITRNCPWNNCKFCGLYKGKKFSIRPVSHVIKDIDRLKYYVDQKTNQGNGPPAPGQTDTDRMAFHSAINWVRGGMESIFLQDANTLIIKPDDLVEILTHIKNTFPQVQRITSYARSHTIARISDRDMTRIAKAGLNRIHIGMESACDEVLAFVKKGVDKKTHITAGQKVKKAGIELSEYIMPGLGGAAYSKQNALDTADAMNQINPDFIRIRTLATPRGTELFQDCQSGAFTKIGDVEAARELLLFLDHLDGITSVVKSDHILNLFQEVEGRLPEDKDKMTAPIKRFLALSPEEQMVYRIGRRTGIFSQINDMENPALLSHVKQTQATHGITLENLESFTQDMMNRFI